MGRSVASLLSVFLFFGLIYGTKLVYLEKPSGEAGTSFLAKIASNNDVRGDYGNFILVVDHGNFFDYNIVFPSFDDIAMYSYYVAEPVHLTFARRSPMPTAMLSFEHEFVLGKAVFAVPKEREDEFIGLYPYDYEFVLVPQTPQSPPSFAEFKLTAPNPKISQVISQVNSKDLKYFVTYLSGENSSLVTRQSQSTGATGATAAQEWLQQEFRSFGFSVSTQPFRSGYSSNVIASLQGNSNSKKYVLVTAHYDDRSADVNSKTARAPGANDNGSGTGALLQIAKLIHANKLSFDYTVVLIAFSGEEQGLLGSAYSAQQFKSEKADIVAVLNADMIAYRDPKESPQLAFASRSSTASLNTLLADVTKMYVDGLSVGTTSACCTDHASFYNQGFAAASYFERNGNIADPEYHKVGDIVNRVGYDIQVQYPLIVKAVFAGLMTVAQVL